MVALEEVLPAPADGEDDKETTLADSTTPTPGR
jgi:hypothetical protein